MFKMHLCLPTSCPTSTSTPRTWNSEISLINRAKQEFLLLSLSSQVFHRLYEEKTSSKANLEKLLQQRKPREIKWKYKMVAIIRKFPKEIIRKSVEIILLKAQTREISVATLIQLIVRPFLQWQTPRKEISLMKIPRILSQSNKFPNQWQLPTASPLKVPLVPNCLKATKRVKT